MSHPLRVPLDCLQRCDADAKLRRAQCFGSKNQPPTKDANTLLILRTRPTSRQIRVFSLHRRKSLALLLRPTRVAGGCLPPWRGPAAGTSAGCRRSWTGRAGSSTRRTPRSRPCWRPRQRHRRHAGAGAAAVWPATARGTTSCCWCLRGTQAPRPHCRCCSHSPRRWPGRARRRARGGGHGGRARGRGWERPRPGAQGGGLA